MIVNEKINTINSKTKQNKDQYNLDRETVKSPVLSSGNVGKYEILIGEDVLLARRQIF